MISVGKPPDMGGLQGSCSRLRLRLLENSMITITITNTRFLDVIDYDCGEITYHLMIHMAPLDLVHVTFLNVSCLCLRHRHYVMNDSLAGTRMVGLAGHACCQL